MVFVAQADSALITEAFMMGVMMNDDESIKYLHDYVMSNGRVHPWLANYVAQLWSFAADAVHRTKTKQVGSACNQ